MPTTTVRHDQPRRASGNTIRIVVMAMVARNAASCQEPNPQNLMAAPPVENSTAAAMILDLGLMVAGNILGPDGSTGLRHPLKLRHARRAPVFCRAAHQGAFRRFE